MTQKISKELKKVADTADSFEKEIRDLTLDQMNKAPIEEHEPQTKLSQKEIQRAPDLYLKPSRTIQSKEAFNEKFRSAWNYAKEYVQITAEHRELIGEKIESWTKPFAGIPAEFWEVPTNKPVWVPRYVAERISACKYHRLMMAETFTEDNRVESGLYGKMVADSTINRLNAFPVSNKKSVFMGASGF